MPDPSLGPALAAVGFAEIDTGLGPTVEVVRPPSDAATAIAAAGGHAGVVRLHPAAHPPERPLAQPIRSRRWCASSSCPPVARSCPQVTVRLDQRAPDTVLADLLGISGPTASRRLTGTPTAAGWAAADGDPATRGRRRSAPPSAPRSTWSTTPRRTSLELTQPSGEHSPITGHPAARRRHDDRRRRPGPRSHRHERHRAPVTAAGRARAAGGHVDRPAGRRSTAATPSRSSCPPASARCPSAPGPPFPSDSTPGAATTSSTVDGEPLPVRIEAAIADLLAGDAGRRDALRARRTDAGRRHPSADDDGRRRRPGCTSTGSCSPTRLRPAGGDRRGRSRR